MPARWEVLPLSDGYKFPQNMPDTVDEVTESMKKRPFYCYRIFINNVDHYVSREIAKFFNGEYFLTPEIMTSMKDTSKPPPEEDKGVSKVMSAGDKKGKKGRRKSQRKSQGGGSRRSSRRSSKRSSQAGRRSSKKQSKSAGKRKSQSPGSRRQSRRKSQKQTKPGSRSSKMVGKGKGKGKSSAKVPTVPADPENVERLIEDLWPKFRREEHKFVKLYDWDADYPFLEDLRLLSKEQIGFELSRAQEFYGEPSEWDEDLRRKMKERTWMFTRCIPPSGSRLSLDNANPRDMDNIFSLFCTEGPPIFPGPGGDASAVKDREDVAHSDRLKPNVVTLVKDFRDKLWKDDRGEKGLTYYNEDLFWGYPTHQVVATRSTPLPTVRGELEPYYIFETIKNMKTREDFQRDIFPCMIQIFDITKSPNCIEEAKIVLDYLIDELLTYSEEVRIRNQALFGIHTFILISPLLTWAETRSLAKQPQDCLREEYFWKRVPHPKYKKHWEFENYVYDKAYQYRDLLKIIIVGVGVVYGNGDQDLKPYYELARRNVTPVLHLGRGVNIVPLLHVQDLARLCLQLTREWPAYTRYIIAAEKKFLTCHEIMEIIAKEIAEGYVCNVPFCFGKGFDVVGEDVHNILYNEYKFNCTYLHDIKKHKFKHDFGTDIKNTFIEYEKEQGYKQTRIVLFGPSDADQRKIGEALAAHYKVPYINGFSAVKIFLRILLDLQNQVLDAATPQPPPKNWKLTEGKSEFFHSKISAPLAWHRETRLLFHRDPKLEEIRTLHKAEVERKDPTSYLVKDLPRPDFFELESLNKAEPQNSKYQEGKEHLLHFDSLKRNGADLLGALIRVDMQALIVHELLKFPTCKNNGYVLDGLPTSEEEVEIIFSKEGTAGAAARPKSMAGPPQPPSQGGRSADEYEYLPSYVFHIKKGEIEAFRDLIKGVNAPTFQKEFMNHFRRMQTHRLIMNRTRSALDFFEDKFNMTTYCFDSGAVASDQITKNIIQMIDALNKPPNDPCVQTVAELHKEDEGLLLKEIENRLSSVLEQSQRQVKQETLLSERIFTKEEIVEAEMMEGRMLKEILKLPDRALGYIHYINKFISKSIVKAAIKAGEQNPEDLIDWTAFYLMANNEGGRMPLNKIIPQPVPKNLSEYPFDVDKIDKKYSAHLE